MATDNEYPELHKHYKPRIEKEFVHGDKIQKRQNPIRIAVQPGKAAKKNLQRIHNPVRTRLHISKTRIII